MRLDSILPAAVLAALGAAALTVPAAGDTPVNIEGADAAARQAILDLLPHREPPTSLFDAERIAEEAAARAEAWLRSEGYYAAQVTPEASDQPPRARLIITPGVRFRFAAPELAFAERQPDPAAMSRLEQVLAGVEAGAPARAEIVLRTEAELLESVRAAGYVDAAIADRRVVVDHASAEVQTRFEVHAGEAARLGALRAEPSDEFRVDFVGRLRNWEDGAPYTPQALAQLRRDIVSTGAVSRATTRLEPPNAERVRDVVLEIDAAPRNAYEAGVGYSTTEGLGVDLEWTRRNFTGRADALTLGATLSELRQSIDAELARPHAAGLNRTRRYGLSLAREESEAFARQGVTAFASVDAEQRLDLGISYGATISADRFDEAGGVRNAYVVSAFGEVRNDTRDLRLDARDGSYVAMRAEPALSTGDATLAFVRATAEGRLYESVGADDVVTLAARANAGWLEALNGDVNDVPPDRRFYAGGGGSVRGYDFNSISPTERDALGLTPGGQGVLEASLEARWRLADRFGAVAFVDGGAAFDAIEDAGDLRWGAGIGVRYDMGFAPLRADIAVPIDPRDGDPDYALYISIGQAF